MFKVAKLVLVAISFGAYFAVISPSLTYAQNPEDVKVTKVTRISHPAYRAANIWYSTRNPWNRDYTRVLIYESSFTHPNYGTTGRGLVWGFVDELKSWNTLQTDQQQLQAYQKAAKPLPENTKWASTSLYWSPFNGEENILYGIYTADKTVSKLNVDTGVRMPLVSYDPGDGTDVSGARSTGWTIDNTLVVNFNGESYSAGYEVDVINKTKKRYTPFSGDCSEERKRFPHNGHGHSNKSPDGSKMAMKFGFGSDDGVMLMDDCAYVEDPSWEHKMDPPYPNLPIYVSWTASENWYLASGDQEDPPIPYLTAPAITTWPIWQVYFDGKNFTYRELLAVKTAARWDPDANHANGNEVRNYHAHLIPVLREDGRQIWFTATDGKYTIDDYNVARVSPWEFESVFLADLAPAGGEADTNAPSVPSNLTA
ncbi:MAG: hypothetical protein ACREBU_16110, partial [Nitrososphaera sp.]